MEFLTLANKRYSCRNYQAAQVENDLLMKVLEAGRVAPSAVNFQPWHFIVIREALNREKVCSCYKREWLRTAPVIIVICGDHSASWKRGDGKDHCDIDIAITVDHMTLQAAELGLGTCWVCNFDANKLSGLMNLPDNLEPVVILPLGYPAENQDTIRHTQRKSIEAIVHWENF